MGSAASRTKVRYMFKNGRPSFATSVVYPMFNHMLYRCCSDDEKRWGFYNDTVDLIIHVAILFDYDSQIVPLGSTTAFRIDDPDEGHEDDYGKYLCEVDIMPGETQMFVEGVVTGWRVDTLEARTAVDQREFRL